MNDVSYKTCTSMFFSVFVRVCVFFFSFSVLKFSVTETSEFFSLAVYLPLLFLLYSPPELPVPTEVGLITTIVWIVPMSLDGHDQVFIIFCDKV